MSDLAGHEGDRFHRKVDLKTLYAVLGQSRADGEDQGGGRIRSLRIYVVGLRARTFTDPSQAQSLARGGRADGAASFINRLTAAADAALNALNLEPYAHYDRLVERIVSNVRNRVNYERLADHGPKLGPITAQCPVVATYFTRLAVPEHDQVRVPTP